VAFQNKFEILASRVMQYGVKREVKVRQQEIEEEVKYFRYWEVGHFKWECPSMEVERQRRRKEGVAHVARPQEAQQERKPAYPL